MEEELIVYTENGHEEAREWIYPGDVIAKRTNPDGSAFVDSYGHMNIWKMVPQSIDADGYLNITDMDSIYGISELEFDETYKKLTENELKDFDFPGSILNEEL